MGMTAADARSERQDSPAAPGASREPAVTEQATRGASESAPADITESATVRSTSPDPTSDTARFQRIERVGVLYGQITAATREFLRAVAECDRHRDWAGEGFACCADWLAWQIGIARGTAREKVRAARALEALPRISEAMGRGEVSFSKVRALTRVASPESEAELLEYARSTSTAGLERLVRGWKALDREGARKVERVQHRLRRFSVYPDGTGMYEVRGKLTAEVAAVLMRAVEAASDALYREQGSVCAGEGSTATGGAAAATGLAHPDSAHPDLAHPDPDRPEPEQLRADALGLLAERALAAGFGARRGGGLASAAEDPCGCGSVPASVSGSRAERYQVMLHVEPATIAASGAPGMSELEDGTRVSAETSRRLSCDASRVVVRKNEEGEVLSVGRRTRTIPAALRRALEVRDRGCRFPGCGLRFTDGHHIEHWADGGRTDLNNTVLLCRRHHRLVHEGGYRICKDVQDRVVFFSPGGSAIAATGQPSELGSDPVGDLMRENRRRGTDPQWDTILPSRHRRAPIPWELEADAWQALDRAAEPADSSESVPSDGAARPEPAYSGEVPPEGAEDAAAA